MEWRATVWYLRVYKLGAGKRQPRDRAKGCGRRDKDAVNYAVKTTERARVGITLVDVVVIVVLCIFPRHPPRHLDYRTATALRRRRCCDDRHVGCGDTTAKQLLRLSKSNVHTSVNFLIRSWLIILKISLDINNIK